MKKCPQCKKIYGDDKEVCALDGTILAPVAETGAASKKAILIFLAILFTAILIGAIGIASMFYNRTHSVLPGSQPSSRTNSVSNTVSFSSGVAASASPIESPASEIAPVTPNAEAPDAAETIETTASLSKDDVLELLNRWEKAQDTRDFEKYRACYDKSFKGIKRASMTQKSYDFEEWLGDRRQMIGSAKNLDVNLERVDISLLKDAAIVNFYQSYKSDDYRDFGQKVINVKQTPDGAKITYEELKESEKQPD